MITLSSRVLVTLALCFGIFPLTALAGSWQQNVSIGGFNSVNIYTPDSNSPVGNGKALLLVLHGCVQPISNYLTANLEDAAEAHGMVIAVPDAANKAGFSCWSYWQGAINRSSGDYANLINLANGLTGDSSRNIDSDQVYISGLSSGAAFASQAACVAPDIFAGVASSAGPTLGTSSNGAISTCETVSPSTFKSRCESYAGSNYQQYLSSQLAVIGHGTADTTVNTCYNQQNANGYANLFGVSELVGTTTVNEGPSNTAQQTLWDHNRISMLWFDGLDHSWSGGAGASGGYVAGNSINFATYLGEFFAQNNLRVNRNEAPVISNYQVTENNKQLSISGIAIDTDGTVDSVTSNVVSVTNGNPVLIETIVGQANSNSGVFSNLSAVLVDGLYEVKTHATDNQGTVSESQTTTLRIGPIPPNSAPILSNVNASISEQCATITGSVVDLDQNLASVTVQFDNALVTAILSANEFSAQQCNLAGGSNSAIITASDSAGLNSNQTINFVVDAGITGDYNLHINEGRISWGVGYSACYLEFGTSNFTMRETPSANQCQWVADGAPSCAGPIQSCQSNSGPLDSDNDGVDDALDNCPNTANSDQADNDNDGRGNVCDSTPNGSTTTCTETRSSNYAHVSAGRAVVSGFSTFAVGSNDAMGFYNIFTFTTLKETSTGYFETGNCD